MTAEIVFYVISPFLFFLVFKWKDRLTSFLVVTALIFFISPFEDFLSPLFTPLNLTLKHTLGVFQPVCFGFIIFLFHKNYVHFTQSFLSKWLGIALFFVALTPLSVTAYHASDKVYSSVSLLLLLFSFVLYPNNPFVNRFFIYIGRLGYSIYLSHSLVISSVIAFFNKFHLYKDTAHKDIRLFIAFSVVLAVTALISIPLQKYIVEPGMAYGSKLGKKILQGGEIQTSSEAKGWLTNK